MIAAFLAGLCLGGALAWAGGIFYGVRREQERNAMLALRRLRSERTFTSEGGGR